MLIENFGHKSGCNQTELATQYNYIIKCFSIQVKLHYQPPVTEEIDEQVQDAANVGYQESLLPEVSIEEQ